MVNGIIYYTIDFANYASTHGWTTSTDGKEVTYTTIETDVVTISVAATASAQSTTGKVTSASWWGSNWRLYSSEQATMTFTAKSGYTIVSIKITASANKNPVFTCGTTTFKNDEVLNVNGSTAVIAVTSGQARITKIDIIYSQGGSTTPGGGGTTSGGGEETNPGGSGSNPGGETNPGAYTFDFVGKYGTYSASWSGTVGSYAERTVSATDLGMQATVEFVFSYASKQASDATIGDRPVLASKGGATEYVTVTATGSTISSVTFNLKEWVTGGTGAPKTFKKLQIEYKTSSGEWTVVNGVGFDGTAQQITDYTTLTATNLPADVTQVRLVYVGGGEKNQQIGLTSIVLTFA